jgi:hypothetical protein
LEEFAACIFKTSAACIRFFQNAGTYHQTMTYLRKKIILILTTVRNSSLMSLVIFAKYAFLRFLEAILKFTSIIPQMSVHFYIFQVISYASSIITKSNIQVYVSVGFNVSC